MLKLLESFQTKQKVKLLEHCYNMILPTNATFMFLKLKNFKS
ncbi:hypothetical protein HPPN120_06040 [Helicobacter pylori Puno120]|nr:hypothetical protein HPPN120_06040 [Helicobacter pylori Puno120]